VPRFLVNRAAPFLVMVSDIERVFAAPGTTRHGRYDNPIEAFETIYVRRGFPSVLARIADRLPSAGFEIDRIEVVDAGNRDVRQEPSLSAPRREIGGQERDGFELDFLRSARDEEII